MGSDLKFGWSLMAFNVENNALVYLFDRCDFSPAKNAVHDRPGGMIQAILPRYPPNRSLHAGYNEVSTCLMLRDVPSQ